MKKYKLSNTLIVDWEVIHLLFPNKSFPINPLSDERLAEMGIEVVEITPSEPTFDELKASKVKEIKDAFDTHVHGFTTTSLGYDMQFNESDSIKLEGAIKLMAAQGLTHGYLTDAHDVTHYDIPIGDIKITQIDMLGAFAQAHAKKQVLRAAVEAATTTEELSAVEW